MRSKDMSREAFVAALARTRSLEEAEVAALAAPQRRRPPALLPPVLFHLGAHVSAAPSTVSSTVCGVSPLSSTVDVAPSPRVVVPVPARAAAAAGEGRDTPTPRPAPQAWRGADPRAATAPRGQHTERNVPSTSRGPRTPGARGLQPRVLMPPQKETTPARKGTIPVSGSHLPKRAVGGSAAHRPSARQEVRNGNGESNKLKSFSLMEASRILDRLRM